MADSDRSRSHIIAMVAAKAGISVHEIRPEHKLLHDLGLYGDDAEELILQIGKVYGIEVADFDFQQYFFPEGFAYWLVPGFLRPRILTRKKPITVADLIRSTELRRWSFT